jgi:uroporphyrinogen-III decarboxylase
MMTRRERLTATLRGEAVDRPAVNFYEIGGYKCDPNDPDPYNIYNAPSWKPLVDLAKEKTDVIQFAYPQVSASGNSELFKTENWEEGNSRFSKATLTVADKTMTQLVRRDAETNTTWGLEHLLKSSEDLKAYLQVPEEMIECQWDCPHLIQEEKELAESGIVMINVGDPICVAAELFSMADFTLIAMLEPELFHQLLERIAARMTPNVRKIAKEYPGKLWRFSGAEYATEPYLPPNLFEEYVGRYTGPLVKIVQEYGGYARIHSHGRIKNALPHIAAMVADALDPIEPPDQGDVELIDVRKEYGENMVLFGNIEITDIENLTPAEFEPKVVQALREGTAGKGRGFVLMPSSSPFGRTITAYTMKNYETMVRLAENWN